MARAVSTSPTWAVSAAKKPLSQLQYVLAFLKGITAVPSRCAATYLRCNCGYTACTFSGAQP